MRPFCISGIQPSGTPGMSGWVGEGGGLTDAGRGDGEGTGIVIGGTGETRLGKGECGAIGGGSGRKAEEGRDLGGTRGGVGSGSSSSGMVISGTGMVMAGSGIGMEITGAADSVAAVARPLEEVAKPFDMDVRVLGGDFTLLSNPLPRATLEERPCVYAKSLDMGCTCGSGIVVTSSSSGPVPVMLELSERGEGSFGCPSK